MATRSGFAAVPIGSWSDYRMVRGAKTFSVRVALVSRTADEAVVETAIELVPPKPNAKTVIDYHLAVHPDDPGSARSVVVQMGSKAPFVAPGMRADFRPFERVDQGSLVATEPVSVPAGRFATARHYRKQAATGQTWDVWLDKAVFPLGIVSFTRNGLADKSHGKAMLPARWDLVRSGTSGARSQIDRPLAPVPKSFAHWKQ
jgi:hypothetical protein